MLRVEPTQRHLCPQGAERLHSRIERLICRDDRRIF
jgi:hypothetical protein